MRDMLKSVVVKISVLGDVSLTHSVLMELV